MRDTRCTTFSCALTGLLTTAAPALGYCSYVVGDDVQEVARLGVAVFAALAMLAGGALLERRPRDAVLLLFAGLGAPAATALDAFMSEPTLTFVAVMGGGAALGSALLSPLSDVAGAVDAVEGRPIKTRWSAYASVGTWLALQLGAEDQNAAAVVTSTIAFSLTLLHALRWTRCAREAHPRRALAVRSVAMAGVVTTPLVAVWPAVTLGFMAACVSISVWVMPSASALWSSMIDHPARLLVATFAALCLGGTVLLGLPAAAEGGAPIALVDAAFTSVSAVCVTGLIVLDTPNAFSGFGEVVILLLIQIGGLGIMTFYSAALSALGRRLSLKHESAIAGALAITDRGQLFTSLGRILRITFAIEAVGALALLAAFLPHYGDPATALWNAVFTSISAFCNAGFALETSSLIPFQREPLVLHTVSALIVLGGLSPAVVVALPDFARSRRTTLQARLALATSIALLIFGFVGFAAIEWTSSLGDLSIGDRLHNAWFQSVTTRTAGFNSVDFAAMRPAAHTLTIALMFIGGSPGGTAGGIKTTTLAVLGLAVLATLRRRSQATAFGRRLGHATIYKAAAVLTMGVLSALGALIAIQLTQKIELGPAVFEVVSALGTVGLSIGATAMLDSVGKVIIAACMFAGRVGPLTLFLFLTEQGTQPSWEHREEEVDVG